MPSQSSSSPRASGPSAPPSVGNPTLAILDDAPVLIWRSGPDAKCDWFNRAWLAFTGRRLEEELGDGWAQGVHPDDLDRCVATYLDAFGARQSFEMEYRLRRQDGQFRWIIDSGRPFANPTGEFGGYMGYCFDVSEHREMAEALSRREQLLAEAQEVGRMGHYLFDVVADHWVSSAMLEEIFGIGPDHPRTLAGWLSLVPQAMRGDMAMYWQSMTARGGDFDKEYVIVRPSDGATRIVHGRGKVTYAADGAPLRMLGTIQDVTEAKTLEGSLRLAASVFANSQQGILITDRTGTIIDANPAFCKLTGYDRNEVMGSNPRMLKSGLQDADFYRRMWAGLLADGSWRGEVWNRKKNGEFYPGILEVNAVADASGHLTHYVGMFSDITDLKRAQSSLERLANYDALTGLPNRTLLSDRLGLAVANAKRHGRPLAVCFLDLDGFKAVNDVHGHETGDHLLIQVAQRLNEILRSGDTVCRLGGDEFILILTDVDLSSELEPVLHRILAQIGKPYRIMGHPVDVTASVGVTLFPNDDSDPDLLIRHADHAMYNAKKAGRNCYRMFANRAGGGDSRSAEED
ncbi:MAG TPA: diguanylate cyclase [Rhodocyclaceae bacterium]|nr:diguanylate cyclase [Rhodocyclaceae bacterium]